jgi:hypothetical protein
MRKGTSRKGSRCYARETRWYPSAMSRRSPSRHANLAPTPSTPVTNRSPRSAIPTAMHGWSRRSRRDSPAESDSAFVSRANLARLLVGGPILDSARASADPVIGRRHHPPEGS